MPTLSPALPSAPLTTLRDFLRWAVSRFEVAGVFYGHGTDNAFDEAAWLVLGALRLPHERLDVFLDARLTDDEREHLAHLIELRCVRRVPTAYLLGEAWQGGLRFRVDERVLIPRSYFAELLHEGFAPWIGDVHAVGSALDLCTGSGCLAVLMALTFPNARVDAVDLSADALALARANIADHGLEERVTPLWSDLFAALDGRRYDLIVSNPPYVTTAAMAALPAEYRHEPALALAGGEDGLDLVRRILAAAPDHLNDGGLLAIEVGHNRALVEAALPTLPLTWLATESGEDKIFLVHKDDLEARR